MDLSMKSKNLFAAFIGIFSCSVLVIAQSSCSAAIYGTPLVKDCFDLVSQLPGGVSSPEIDVDALRSFVEPKFLQPSFAPVHDAFGTGMVQLPKVWKKNTCCLALLSIATPRGIVQTPTSVDKWRTVQNAFIDTVQSCIIKGPGKGSGGMLYANMNKPDAKVVYIYARESPFEGSLNKYMSSYKQGLNPEDPTGTLIGSTTVNSSIIERTVMSSLGSYLMETEPQIA